MQICMCIVIHHDVLYITYNRAPKPLSPSTTERVIT